MVRTIIFAILFALLLGGCSANAHEQTATSEAELSDKLEELARNLEVAAGNVQPEQDPIVVDDNEWIPVITTPTKAVLKVRYKDYHRIQVVGTFWLKVDHSRDATVKYRSAMILQEIDCKGETLRGISSTYYDASGKSLSSSDLRSYVPSPIIPDSAGAMMQRFVCTP